MVEHLSTMLHFSTSSTYYVYQSTIKYHELVIYNHNKNFIGNRIKLARNLFNLTLQQTYSLTGISPYTLSELENSTRNSISRNTIVKLVNVFPSELILTDYHKFILNQKEVLKHINKYELGKLLNINPSTIQRWKDEKYIVKYDYYLKLKELGIIP